MSALCAVKHSTRLPHYHPAPSECCVHTIMLIACNTDVQLCCTRCPALPCPCACAIICRSFVVLALPQQQQVSIGVACIGGMLACSRRLWRMPTIVANPSVGHLLVPWKGLLYSELPQQGVVYESIDYACRSITHCPCLARSALLGRTNNKEHCHEAYAWNTCKVLSRPWSTIMHAPASPALPAASCKDA